MILGTVSNPPKQKFDVGARWSGMRQALAVFCGNVLKSASTVVKADFIPSEAEDPISRLVVRVPVLRGDYPIAVTKSVSLVAITDYVLRFARSDHSTL